MFEVSKYLSISKDLEHVGIKSFHCFVMPNEDLLLYGTEVQGVRDLLVIVSVPGTQSSVAVNVARQLLYRALQGHHQCVPTFSLGEDSKVELQGLAGKNLQKNTRFGTHMLRDKANIAQPTCLVSTGLELKVERIAGITMTYT